MTATLTRILAHHGPAPALRLDGRSHSYAEVIDRALALAGRLAAVDPGPHRVAAVLAHKSLGAYAGALACHCAGLGYLPLNPKFPAERLAAMLRRGGAGSLVVDGESRAALSGLLATLPPGRLPAVVDAGRDGTGGGLAGPLPHAPEAAAYLLFTSGSTGQPKGVPVSFANLESYVGAAASRWPLVPGDLASQTFDLTFDLSAHDLFLTWAAGACLCPLPDPVLLNPAGFIRDSGLTVWFSVPSVAMMMARARTLRPGLFPDLRLSLFCGEPLPAATARAWAAAALNSRVANLYGPTEATIAIAAFDWDAAAAGALPPESIVPIGRVFPGQRHCLVAGGRPLTGPGRGELCLAGSQVTVGYLDAPDRTAAQYVRLPGLAGLWYRTGDLVEEDASGLLHFIGRIDFQVKIAGYRVELGEVEAALRAACGCDGVVVLPWPVEPGGGARGLAAFVLAEERDPGPILTALRRTLPDYMVPARIVWRRSLPLNANGKVDRESLVSQLNADSRRTGAEK